MPEEPDNPESEAISERLQIQEIPELPTLKPSVSVLNVSEYVQKVQTPKKVGSMPNINVSDEKRTVKVSDFNVIVLYCYNITFYFW